MKKAGCIMGLLLCCGLSAGAQELAVKKLNENKYPGSTFVGTSNVFLAKKYGITPVGTMAHE